MKKIFKDGIYDISNEDYHASTAISRSQLKLLDKSPYHFWYEVLSGEAEKKEPTPAMRLGSAFHTLLLEQHLFDKEYIVKPDVETLPKLDRKKDVGAEEYERQKAKQEEQRAYNKRLLDEFELKKDNKIVLNQKEYDTVREMVSLAKRHEIVKTLVDESLYEKSIFWTDKETGIQFRARPDIWSPNMIVDVKTTHSASLYKMTRSALDESYYLQAGMMYEACKAIGKPFKMFVILAIEKTAPFAPAVFKLSDDALQYGIDMFQLYKKRLKKCLDSKQWPSYPVQELSVPEFAVEQLKNEEGQ